MKDRLNIYDFFEFVKEKKILLSNSWNPTVPRVGRIDMNSMKELLPKPGEETLIMVCGTPGMKDLLCGPKNKETGQREVTGYLSNLGYTNDMIHVF